MTCTYDHTRNIFDGSRTCRWINAMAVTLSQQNVVICAYEKREEKDSEGESDVIVRTWWITWKLFKLGYHQITSDFQNFQKAFQELTVVLDSRNFKLLSPCMIPAQLFVEWRWFRILIYHFKLICENYFYVLSSLVLRWKMFDIKIHVYI